MQVKIRPLIIEDAKTSYKWRNNPEVWKYTGSKPDRIITEDIETEWIKNVLKRNNEMRFAIIVDGKYIGNTQLTNIENQEVNFHIFIGEKDYWGKGIGSQVLKLMIEVAKNKNFKKIKLNVNSKNIAAYKMYIKYGFNIISSNNDFISMALIL